MKQFWKDFFRWEMVLVILACWILAAILVFGVGVK